jgi:cyclophilin family peptidyl-prolyl cis-trans isomerase
MRPLLLLAGAGACGGGGSSEPTCRDAVEHVAKLLDHSERQVDHNFGSCKRDDWPVAIRSCFADASDEDDVRRCGRRLANKRSVRDVDDPDDRDRDRRRRDDTDDDTGDTGGPFGIARDRRRGIDFDELADRLCACTDLACGSSVLAGIGGKAKPPARLEKRMTDCIARLEPNYRDDPAKGSAATPAVRPPVAADLAEALAGLPGRGKRVLAMIGTSHGVIRCDLLPDAAPLAVASFIGLATGTKPWIDPTTGDTVKRPFYDGLIFHRVIPDFMIQGGDPLGRGSGGPGYKFDDEIGAGLKMEPGTLAMANAGPGTNGSTRSSAAASPST